MAKDFEQIGHKNIELLRFYLGKDISKIDKKIQDAIAEIPSVGIATTEQTGVVKASNEVKVAADGAMSIGSVSTDKLV